MGKHFDKYNPNHWAEQYNGLNAFMYDDLPNVPGMNAARHRKEGDAN